MKFFFRPTKTIIAHIIIILYLSWICALTGTGIARTFLIPYPTQRQAYRLGRRNAATQCHRQSNFVMGNDETVTAQHNYASPIGKELCKVRCTSNNRRKNLLTQNKTWQTKKTQRNEEIVPNDYFLHLSTPPLSKRKH